MIDQFFPDPTTLQRFYVGPLGCYIEAFVSMLLEQGYAQGTIKRQIWIVANLSWWLHQQQLSLQDLDEQRIAKFIQHRRRRYCIHRSDTPTLRLLVNYLRDAGVIPRPIPKVDDTELGRIGRSFTQYLVQERKLSQATLNNTLPFVRQFLTGRFGSSPILLGELRPRDITNFVLRYAHSFSPARAKLMVGALRSFFRFLRLRGDIATDLAAAVPTVANWQFTKVPKYIPAEQVERLLQGCDQNTIIGQRDHTILLLLARLGLRAFEVVNMTLDDIDWEAGELIIRGKGSLQDRLPLPYDVGNALATYLRHGRPPCTTRRVFIRVIAPRRGFIASAAVYSIVERAFERVGIQAPQRGPHILRHSLATEALRKGASLPEIGELLRHRVLSTTEIYAKVDLESLRALAQPWPGGETWNRY